MKLDIGAGKFKKEGFLGVDPFTDADINAPMWSIPVPDNSVDEIYSSHSLEHIGKREVVPTLREWKRILKPFAFAVIEVPDLVWCCKNWLFRQTNDWHLDVLFGNQEHDGEFHKTGFTVPIMQGYLNEAGLELVSSQTIQSHGQDTLQFVVRKSI